jgi:hypothetical protein
VRTACAALAALAIVTIPGLARAAEGRTSSLSWVRMPGAEPCVATQALARAVEERLGRTVFVSAAQADVSVEGRIDKLPDARGWSAHLVLRDGRGETLGTRDLAREEPSCEAMTEPLALVIAVMIDPDAAMRPTPPADPPPVPAARPEASPEAPAEPPRDEAAPAPLPTASPADKKARESWRFEGDVYGTVAHGFAPKLAVGAGVQGTLYPPGVPLGFRGYTSLFLPSTLERAGAAGPARASFDMIYAGGSLCPLLVDGRFGLLACAGGQLGAIRPRPETGGRGIDSSLMPLLNAVLELRATLKIAAPIGATAGVAGALPLLRPTTDFTGPGGQRQIFHELAAVAFIADVGLGFFFP